MTKEEIRWCITVLEYNLLKIVTLEKPSDTLEAWDEYHAKVDEFVERILKDQADV